MSLLNNPEYIADLNGNGSTREVGGKWGVHSTTVLRHRRRKGVPTKRVENTDFKSESFEHRPDGSSDYSVPSDRPWGKSDVEAFLREKGEDPDKVTYTWGVTSSPNGGYWNKLNNVRRISKAEEGVSMELVKERILAYKPRNQSEGLISGESLVIMATDFQIGKTDWHGGTDETLENVLEGFHKAAKMAFDYSVDEIVIVDAGDIIENEYNVSSQIATNDLSLPWQVGTAMQIMLEGITILAEHAPSIKYVAVSSNHGAHRKGLKAPAADVHSDYGLVIASLLKTALKLNSAYDHVEVILPEPYMESVAFETSGSRIGVVHGHQVSSPDKLGDWWKGQSHGNMPTADARILLSGHWHSLRIQQSGDSRWIFVGPSSDPGSSWFTNLKGESSQPGMLAFLTHDDTWSDVTIL